MSFKIGGSKTTSSNTSSTNTSSNSNSASHSSTTPTVPQWASDLTQGVAGRVGGLLALNPQSLVAPPNGLQQQAAAGARDLSGSAWNFDHAADIYRQAAQQDASTYRPATGEAADGRSASVLDNLEAYMSPYRRDVVDAALADYDFGAGQTRAQQDLDLAGSGAFGGSGAAITRSMTEDALTRGRATTSSNLFDQMFQRGAALSADDANRRQQASFANAGAANQVGLANLGALNEASRYNAGAADAALQRRMDAARGLTDLSGAFDANQRANIATQANMGDALRNIDQQQRQAPITTNQQIVAMLQGLPIGLFTGQETDGTQTSSGQGTSNTVGSGTTRGSDWGLSANVGKMISEALTGGTSASIFGAG